ncbi:Multidrug efflux pump subunit AcrA [Alphaproteobacteria bacterium SO-S41]|nr:Multidrug efflux pump subunit AcrA [Alphaproteobacteria bacterium SO-S41]
MRLTLAALASAAGLSALFLAVPSAPAQDAPSEPPPPVVVVAAVTTERMAETVTVPGSVVSRNDSKIAAEVAGRVEWVAEVGAVIEAGGPVARIDSALLKLQARSAEASLKRLEAQLVFLNAEVARLEELIGKGSATRQRLDEARSQRDMARQELAEAQVQLERANYDLEHSEVKSPFPGRVVKRLIEPGEYIERGAATARVVDTTALEVSAQIPIASVAQLKEGDKVTIEGPGATAAAVVRALVPVGDEVSRSAEMRATLDGAQWLIGTAVKVATPNAPAAEVVAVPRDAVLLKTDGSAVFRIGEGEIAELVPVQVGLSAGDRVAVIGGLHPGDRVVVRGGETLQAGQKVQVQAENGPNASMPSRPG